MSILLWAPAASCPGQMPKSVVFLLFHSVLQSCGLLTINKNGSYARALPTSSPCPSEHRGRPSLFLIPSSLQIPTSHGTQIIFHLLVHLASSYIVSVSNAPVFRETEASFRFSVLLTKEFKNRLRSSRIVY